MDTFGHEVAVKIKSAIKAKLMELNSYVDDELPDYIMVMVANKKSKAQMATDLALFLGENAEKFCEWLDEVLKRIQAVTIEPSKKGETKSLETTDDDIEAKSTTDVPNNGTDSEISAVIRQEPEVHDEFLAIKAETDDLLVEELNKDDSSKVEEVVTKTENESQEVRPRRNISPITMEPSNHKPTSTTSVSRKRKIPSSTVGAVLKREFPREEDEEDGYDPRHPSIGSVASVVQVSKRRPTLPPEKQANTALLLKAVNDAQKSVLRLSKNSSTVKTVVGDQPRLFTKSYLERERLQEKKNEAITTNKDEQKNVETVDSEVKLMDYDDLEADDVVNSSADFEDAKLKPSSNRVVKLQEKVEKCPPASPEFIITLDGVDAATFVDDNEEVEMEDELEMTVQDESLQVADDDDVLMEDDSKVETNGENSNIRCKYWPVCKNGNQCNYHHPTITCKTFPNCKFGNQCLYIHPNCKFDATCSRSDCPFTHASPRNPFEIANKNRPPVIIKKAATPAVAPYASKIVCRDFPACKNVDCAFFHPKSCRYGQGCTRADCIFFHPNSFPAPDKMKWKAKTSNKDTESNQITNSEDGTRPIHMSTPKVVV